MKKITEYLKQEDGFLITNQPCTITIDLSNYSKENMREDDKQIWVSSLLCKIEYSDKMFDIVLDYPLFLQVYSIEKIGKEFIKLKYDQNAKILEVSQEAAESKVRIAYVERLISGKEILKDPEHLLNKLFSVYGSASGMDLVHLEILESQVLRDKHDPQKPARLGKTWDPVMMNMKKIIFNEGFVNSLAFENINEAIKMGLISSEKRDLGIIERVMTGQLTKE